MGGSGGSGGIPRLPKNLERLIADERSKESDRLNTLVNEYLAEMLAQFNSRDPELTNRRLDQIAEAIEAVVEVDRVLLGGSVAKHTAVDGVSDIDAIVVVDRPELKDERPARLRGDIYAELDGVLSRAEVEAVEIGEMAVTVRYRDGMEVQVLPALRADRGVLIGGAERSGWLAIDPKRFQEALSSANKRLGGALVPAIKLLKSMNADLPKQKQLKSYHIEALAVEAAGHFSGPKVPREALIHLCGYAAERVLRPIQDITGQSRSADEYLGPASSVSRRLAAQTLAGLHRRLEAASSLDEWKQMLEG